MSLTSYGWDKTVLTMFSNLITRKPGSATFRDYRECADHSVRRIKIGVGDIKTSGT